MSIKTKILSMIMAGCILTSSVSADARAVNKLSESWKKYGITATGIWEIEYYSTYRQFNSKISASENVSKITTGIYVYRMDNNKKVGEDFYSETNWDECEAAYGVPYNYIPTPLKANASFYAKNDNQAYPIVNLAVTAWYVTESD